MIPLASENVLKTLFTEQLNFVFFPRFRTAPAATTATTSTATTAAALTRVPLASENYFI
jgi:hypothetical protein